MFAPRPAFRTLASPVERARSRLGMTAGDVLTAEALAAAFRRAALAAHPDRPGGDADRFRAVVEAYRLLKRADVACTAQASTLRPQFVVPNEVAARPAPSGVISARVEIDPLTAVRGGLVSLTVAGRARRARVPAGVRQGDRLRLMLRGGEVVLVTVGVRDSDDLSLQGADLHQDVAVHPRKLAEGGRLTVQTHAGPRDLWLARVRPAALRYVLKDLGLPSLNGRSAGRLIVRLIPSAAEPTPAEAMLDRFEADWAAPLAA